MLKIILTISAFTLILIGLIIALILNLSYWHIIALLLLSFILSQYFQYLIERKIESRRKEEELKYWMTRKKYRNR